MDVTYTLQDLGFQTFLVNYYTGLTAPYFLIGFTSPDGTETKFALIEAEGGERNWRLSIDGVNDIYEDLDAGYVYFGELGTWKGDVYYQASAVNTDPDNAFYLGAVLFQVVENIDLTFDYILDVEL